MAEFETTTTRATHAIASTITFRTVRADTELVIEATRFELNHDGSLISAAALRSNTGSEHFFVHRRLLANAAAACHLRARIRSVSSREWLGTGTSNASRVFVTHSQAAPAVGISRAVAFDGC